MELKGRVEITWMWIGGSFLELKIRKGEGLQQHKE